ncbi:hypothetical protein BD414DRAFT_493430 [Trametes punicea]|nr:hypothetical protein BD414DRAFT_493430 [Trametes punicea]
MTCKTVSSVATSQLSPALNETATPQPVSPFRNSSADAPGSARGVATRHPGMNKGLNVSARSHRAPPQ